MVTNPCCHAQHTPKCTLRTQTHRLTHTRIAAAPLWMGTMWKGTSMFQERSEQAVDLAQEVAAVTAQLHEAIAQEQRQAAQLEQERRRWADHQQHSAAETEAAGAQIAQLQGLLEDAHRQLGVAKVGGFFYIAPVWLVLSKPSDGAETGHDASAGGSGPVKQHGDTHSKRQPAVWSGMRTRSPCAARRPALLGPRHEDGCSSAPA